MYEEFYNLSALPFQLTPDHRFFFGSDVHKRAMGHLEFGLSQGEGFIVITGEIGSGKTTLIRHLLAQHENAADFVAANVTSSKLEGDDIVRMVSQAFGIETVERDKASLLRDLESFLVQTYKRGARCVLIADEAQNLSVSALEEMRMFANFQYGHAAVLQVIMVGQPEFRATLGMPQFDQLRQRILASYHLGPINPAETREYVTHRLRAVGWKSDPSISDEAFTEIYHFSEGVPRRINTLCSRIFLYGYLEERHHIDAGDVRQVGKDLEAERLDVVAPPNAHAPDAAANTANGVPVLDPPAIAPVPVAGHKDVELSAALMQKIDHRLQALERRMDLSDKLLKMLSIAIGRAGARD